MRLGLAIAVFVMGSSAATAQEPRSLVVPGGCGDAHARIVSVRMQDGTTKQGTLLCFDAQGLVLAGPRRVERVPLDEVTRVWRPADPVQDGALKGAAFGLVLWAFCHRVCSPAMIVGYTLVGTTLDALDPHTEEIYRRSRRWNTAVAVKLRF